LGSRFTRRFSYKNVLLSQYVVGFGRRCRGLFGRNGNDLLSNDGFFAIALPILVKTLEPAFGCRSRRIRPG
jgi:hypothetical protein